MFEDLFISKNKTLSKDIILLLKLSDEKKSYNDITLNEKRTILLYYLTTNNPSEYVISKDMSKESINQIIDYCNQTGRSIIQECSYIIINHTLYGEKIDLILSNLKLIKKYFFYFNITENHLTSICKELEYENLLSFDFNSISFNLKLSILKKIQIEVIKNKERCWYINENEFYNKCKILYKNLIEKYESTNKFSDEEKKIIFFFTKFKSIKELSKTEKSLVFLTKDEQIFYAENNEKLVVFAISKCISGEDKFSDDVIGDGFEGLAKALKSFRKDFGFEFTTYAYKCIVRNIQYSKRKTNSKKRRITNDINSAVLMSSLDEPIANNNTSNERVAKIDMIIDEEEVPVEQIIENKFINNRIIEIVNEMLSYLSEQERFVLKYRFGIGVEKKRQIEIAKMLNTTQSYIHQLEKRGKNKIFEKYQNNPIKTKEITEILNR